MIPYKICCLTYKTLDFLVKRVLSWHIDPEIEVTIIEGAQEGIIQGLNQVEAEGCDVIIGGGANAQVARENCGIPVLEYCLTVYDYLEAIDKAASLGDRMAFCTFIRPIEPALQKYLDKKKIPCINIIYDNEEDLRKQILANPGVVVIGAAFSTDIAMQLGFKHILIYPGEEAVMIAFRDAKALAMQLRRQTEYYQFAQAVIDYSTNGLSLVNAEGLIIDFNTAAEQIWGIQSSVIKGSRVETNLEASGYIQFRDGNKNEMSEVRNINGEPVLCKWVRLLGKSQNNIGAVGIFSRMSDIMHEQYKYERNLKREQITRGFTAKMHFNNIIGSSDMIKKTIAEAKLIARGDANILILGETGAGKEIFAQSIHNESLRKNGPFIAINCAALPESLLESELFGYDEGAFTGSKRGGKKGLFELAGKGTIFLDEIGELSVALQSRLLRVLQEHEIMHVGGDRVIPVNVRVISATNLNLEKETGDRFRRDLYYRLNVLELLLPALRKRKGDALELFTFFLKQKGNLNISFNPFPEEVSRIISEYDWPGNIRELQNVCERFVLFLNNNMDQNKRHLQKIIVQAIGEDRLLRAILEKYGYLEKKGGAQLIGLLQNILGLSKSEIAKKLGVSRTTLWRKNK